MLEQYKLMNTTGSRIGLLHHPSLTPILQMDLHTFPITSPRKNTTTFTKLHSHMRPVVFPMSSTMAGRFLLDCKADFIKDFLRFVDF